MVFGVLPFTVSDEKRASAFCHSLSRMKNGLRRFAERCPGQKMVFGVLPNVTLENLELRFSAVKINSQLPTFTPP